VPWIKARIAIITTTARSTKPTIHISFDFAPFRVPGRSSIAITFSLAAVRPRAMTPPALCSRRLAAHGCNN